MTNAEKYLKDGVVVDNFAEDFLRYLIKLDSGKLYKGKPTVDNLKEFLNLPAKPTLSEDEKVILKNISPRYTRIARTSINKDLYVTNNDKTIQHFLFALSHLFQFIKPGEEYKISDLFGDDTCGTM